jgi:hypothetical protein
MRSKFSIIPFAFFLLDLFFIVMHVLFFDKRLFNLDNEHNLPTIYQGLKLAFIGASALVPLIYAHLQKQLNRRVFFIWTTLAFCLAFVGIDDLSQFHEKLHEQFAEFSPALWYGYLDFFHRFGYRATTWVLVYFPIGLLGGGFLVYAFSNLVKAYGLKTWFPAIIGTFLFVFVAVLEIISTSDIQSRFFRIWVIWEEYFELTGASLWGVTILNIARSTIRQLEPQNDQTLKTSNKLMPYLYLGPIPFAVITCLIFSIISFQNQIQQEEILQQFANKTPSRAANQDCFWQEHLASDIGIHLFVEQCDNNKIKVLSRNDEIYALPEYGTIQSLRNYRVLEHFTKPHDQPITDSIWANFIAVLDEKSRNRCIVVEDGSVSLATTHMRAYRIVARQEESLDYIDCGPYKDANGYFVYDDTKSVLRMIFVYDSPANVFIDKPTIELK